MKLIIHMIKKIFDISKLPDKLRNLTTTGMKVSFVALLFSTLLMALYIDFKSSNSLFEISSLLIKSTSTFLVSFLIFGVSFNRIIRKERLTPFFWLFI